MISFGKTGTMMPSANMSSNTVTKMNAKAARPWVGPGAGPLTCPIGEPSVPGFGSMAMASLRSFTDLVA
jgi:hypothetical protein